jgi:hypothetical protein
MRVVTAFMRGIVYGLVVVGLLLLLARGLRPHPQTQPSETSMQKTINGKVTVLRHKDTGRELNPGDAVAFSNGKKGVLVDARPPHKPASSGFVYVRPDPDPDIECEDLADTSQCRDDVFTAHEYYPTVIGAEWAPHPHR